MAKKEVKLQFDLLSENEKKLQDRNKTKRKKRRSRRSRTSELAKEKGGLGKVASEEAEQFQEFLQSRESVEIPSGSPESKPAPKPLGKETSTVGKMGDVVEEGVEKSAGKSSELFKKPGIFKRAGRLFRKSFGPAAVFLGVGSELSAGASEYFESKADLLDMIQRHKNYISDLDRSWATKEAVKETLVRNVIPAGVGIGLGVLGAPTLPLIGAMIGTAFVTDKIADYMENRDFEQARRRALRAKALTRRLGATRSRASTIGSHGRSIGLQGNYLSDFKD